MKKNIIVVVASFIVVIGIGLNVQASNMQITEQSIQVENQSENSTRAEIIDWRYKIVNGVLYRRLFNYTRNEWIGNWEKV